MAYPPVQLQLKTEELRLKWDAYVCSPDFEPFVEFAVCISSFSEFLNSRGLSGLQRQSHRLEQQVLALFDEVDKHQMAPATAEDLRSQIEGLTKQVAEFILGNTHPVAQRRAGRETGSSFNLIPTHRVWFVGDASSQQRALTAQLAYFGIQADAYCWDSVTTNQTKEPAIVLLDMQGITLEAACEHIQVMRARFAASKLIAMRFQTDFNNLKAALRVGCDLCFSVVTSQAVILAKIIELCSNEEEPPYRVLVVEDSLTASTSIQRTLSQSGIESLAVMNPAEVLTGLRSFLPDLILMDMYMPGCTGVEATRIIRQHAEFLSIPVIYLSGEGNMALQVDAMRLGGDHFLTKPFNPVFLNAVVTSKIERYRALRRTMMHDGLTGLLNHRTVKEKLEAAVKTASASRAPLALAMIDIDHFKRVNDKYGHPMGDQVIRSLAWLLKQHLRKTDIAGRYGGEEFLVILPGSSAEQAYEILDRVRRNFSHIRYSFEDGWFGATFSAGVAQFTSPISAELLIKDADEALYDAKHGGRNCVTIHA